jgi:pimeloyl-ACP methyl ester carboxylesterase
VSDVLPRLLIPGSLCDARLFESMCSHWPNNRLFVVADLHTLKNPSDWCQLQLERLPDCFDIVGFSLGGLLAQSMLRLAPQRIRALVLLASSADPAGPTQAERWQAQQSQWQQIGPRALAQAMSQQASPRLSPAQQQLVQDMAESTPEIAFQSQGEFNASRPSGFHVLSECPAALCLISGAHDPWCTPAVQQRIQQARPDAAHWVLPDAGHYLPLEAPAEVAQATEQFLSALQTTH